MSMPQIEVEQFGSCCANDLCSKPTRAVPYWHTCTNCSGFLHYECGENTAAPTNMFLCPSCLNSFQNLKGNHSSEFPSEKDAEGSEDDQSLATSHSSDTASLFDDDFKISRRLVISKRDANWSLQRLAYDSTPLAEVTELLSTLCSLTLYFNFEQFMQTTESCSW